MKSAFASIRVPISPGVAFFGGWNWTATFRSSGRKPMCSF